MNNLLQKIQKHAVALTVTAIAACIGGYYVLNPAPAHAGEVVMEQVAPAEVVVDESVAAAADECAGLKAAADSAEGLWEKIDAKLDAIGCKVFGPSDEQAADIETQVVETDTPQS